MSVLANLHGWGKVGNVTGGSGGDTLYFNESTLVNGQIGFLALWETMKLNLSTPLNLIWTGGNIELEMINYRIDSNGLTSRTNSPKNKTILGTNGQLIEKGSLQMRGWENIIWRNFERQNTVENANNEGDAFSVINSENIWIDHILFDGLGTGDNQNATITDGCIDITDGSDMITVSNCEFKNVARSMLIGAGDTNLVDPGKLNTTIYGCKFFGSRIRSPFGRRGRIHVYNCFWDWGVSPTFYSAVHEVGRELRVVAHGNHYKLYNVFLVDQETSYNEGGLLLFDNIVGTTPKGSFTPPQYNYQELRPENVTWFDPLPNGYTYQSIPKEDVETYVNTRSGNKWHLFQGILLNLTLTTTTGGSATRDPASGTIESGSTVILTATADTGFNFSAWREGTESGDILSTNPTYNHVMVSDITIVAVFVEDVVIPPGGKGKKLKMRKPKPN